ncbi:MAG: ATP synthase F1 subunit delta [Polyangiaceae bacterium]
MIAPHIARRYAKALMEIGVEQGNVDAVVAEVAAVAAAYESSEELQEALENPVFAHEAKHAVLAEIASHLGLSPMVKNTILFMADRRRMPVLPTVAQLLREMNDLRAGVVRAVITTAAPLSDAYFTRLQAQLEKMTGKKVVLDKHQDPSIIAGVMARIGDTVYDGSLRSRLQEMKTSFLENDATT